MEVEAWDGPLSEVTLFEFNLNGTSFVSAGFLNTHSAGIIMVFWSLTLKLVLQSRLDHSQRLSILINYRGYFVVG